MPCYHPKTAYKNPEGRPFFERPHGHSGATLKLPCNRCIGCRIDRTNEWSLRMQHENQMHESSYFLTLTYSPENLPDHAELNPRHLTLFWKRLRKHTGKKLRYAASGEYGETFDRPHYHAIVYGLHLDDLVQIDQNNLEQPLYTSELLTKIWKHGSVGVGSVTAQSCAYVAGYTLKQAKQGIWKSPTDIFEPETGELRQKLPEFARFSTNPAIGKSFLEKYWSDIFPHGHVIDRKGRQHPVPAYYLKQLAKVDPGLADKLADERRKVLTDPKVRWNNSPERLAVRKKCFLSKAGTKQRGSYGGEYSRVKADPLSPVGSKTLKARATKQANKAAKDNLLNSLVGASKNAL